LIGKGELQRHYESESNNIILLNRKNCKANQIWRNIRM